MQGKEYGREYDLDGIIGSIGKRLITVGRDMTNSVMIEDYDESYISRRHCTLEKVGAEYWQIRDGQWDPDNVAWKTSMNGTYVNSDTVSQNGRLMKDGDIITIGDVKLKFDIR